MSQSGKKESLAFDAKSNGRELPEANPDDFFGKPQERGSHGVDIGLSESDSGNRHLHGQEFGKGEAKVEDKKVNWHNVQKFDTPNVKGDYNLVAFQTFKEVGGEKEAIGTYCSKFQVANKQQ